jgi:hypothetical protein
VLKSIDVLIGLIVVLLALSMAVTMITQAITTMLNSRGRHLRRGLTDLLQQLDPALTETVSKAVATRLLTHPLVSGASSPIAAAANGPGLSSLVRRLAGGARLGNVVHREEFTKLLLHLADDSGPQGLGPQAIATLKSALARNGIQKPAATLAAIRTLALRLERSNPELSHVARQNLAILEEAESDFAAKINSWFDQSMDRTSQRFTASTRAITFAGAFIVAFGLQVDTLSLANRLAADDVMRQAFVNRAVVADKARQQSSVEDREGAAVAPVGNRAQGNKGDPAAAEIDEEMARKYRVFLAEHGVIRLPGAGWIDTFLSPSSFFGVLITALLLSLGAPFWYSALSNLLQLRSVLAVKEDAQRTVRQSNDPPAAARPGTTASARAGERGDLLAVG